MVDPLPQGWTQAQLGDLADWYSGGTPRTSEPSYWNGDIPWITSGSLTQFYLRDSARRLTTLGLQRGSRLVPENSIIFVVRGMSLKTEFRIGITMRPVAFGQDCKALVPKSTVDPLFLAQAIRARTDVVLAMVDEAGHGTGRLATDRIKSLPIALPPLPEQQAIASVFSTLDDKIELNQKLAVSADALWRSSVAAVVQPIEESGNLDKEAEIRPLSALADFINGRAFTKGATGTGPMVVRIAELNSGPGASTVYNDIDVSVEYLAEPGSLLFAWSGSLTVRRWFRPEAIINQHIFNVVPKPGIPMWLVHWHILNLLPGYQRIAAGKATTMGHIQRRDLDITVVTPVAGTLAKLDSICTPLWKRALQAEVETLGLVAIRDMLLPKLLSGELRVRSPEQLVEATV